MSGDRSWLDVIERKDRELATARTRIRILEALLDEVSRSQVLTTEGTVLVANHRVRILPMGGSWADTTFIDEQTGERA